MARRDVSSPTARDQAVHPVVIRRGDPGFGRTGPGMGRGILKVVGPLAFLAFAYVGVGQFRHEIVEAVPGSYGVMRALGFGDVAEPVGYGLELSVAPALQRIEADGARWILLNARITNTADRPVVVPDLAVTVVLRNGRNLAWSQEMRAMTLARGQTHTVQLRYLVGNVSGPPFPGVESAVVKFVRK